MYFFKLSKGDFSISVGSEYSQLIKEEFTRTMVGLFPNASIETENVFCEPKIEQKNEIEDLIVVPIENITKIETENNEIVDDKIKTQEENHLAEQADCADFEFETYSLDEITEDIFEDDYCAYANNQPESIEEEQFEAFSITQNQELSEEHSGISGFVTKLPNNFAELLKEKENLQLNVVEKKDSELKNAYLQMQNIIKEKKLKKELDYILCAAYCISHFENQQRFTNVQLKAKIAPFFDEEIDENYILDAVDKNLIRIVPDFTGFSDNIEYELTQFGEEYFINEL